VVSIGIRNHLLLKKIIIEKKQLSFHAQSHAVCSLHVMLQLQFFELVD
jgi:hypothetical protein